MPSPASGRRAGCSQAVVVGLAWVLGFALAAWLAAVCLPPAELPPGVREKLAHLDRRGDDYDAIFVGSSHVEYHIIPTLFDRYSAGHGVALKSFNAGIAGMSSPEDGYMLDEILRRPHRRLRWVFIELNSFSSGEHLQRAGTLRVAYWHDWERMILLSKNAWNQFRSIRFSRARRRRTLWSERAAAYLTPILQWLDHVRIFSARSLSLGRGAALADPLRTASAAFDPGGADGSLGKYGDGWSYAGDGHQRMSGEELAHYEREYAERLATPSHRDPRDPVDQEALEHLLAKVARSGAQPILFVPPTPAQKHFYPPSSRAQALTIFDFSDMLAYPELFKTENRQDIEHLNGAGAEVFSRILAERFVELIRSAP